MNPHDSLALYLGGLEPAVRVPLLGAQHVATLERALEESRIFANDHRGFGVRSSWRTELLDDPMELGFHTTVPRTAASAQPRSHSLENAIIAENQAILNRTK